MRERADYERALACALREQFGSDWWLRGASEQSLLALARARDEFDRARIRIDLENDAIAYAHGCIQAGIIAGVAHPAP